MHRSMWQRRGESRKAMPAETATLVQAGQQRPDEKANDRMNSVTRNLPESTPREQEGASA